MYMVGILPSEDQELKNTCQVLYKHTRNVAILVHTHTTYNQAIVLFDKLPVRAISIKFRRNKAANISDFDI